MLNIRPFELATDLGAAFGLWRDTLNMTWPLDETCFRRILLGSTTGQSGVHLVAERDGQFAGWLPSDVAPNAASGQPVGNIAALVISPMYRRQGIGAALHTAAIDRLRARGVHRVQLGGGDRRFWPGVPANLPDARTFWERKGWTWDHAVADLTQDLRALLDGASYLHTAAEHGWRIDVAASSDVADLLAFEAREFPEWHAAFAQVIALGDTHDCLIARDAAGDVIGSLVLYSATSYPDRTDVIWQGLLGDGLGALGAVGVAAARQGQGIGSAMVARGGQILQQRGATIAFVGWVWAIDFYRRLGYDVWRTYQMSHRELDRMV